MALFIYQCEKCKNVFEILQLSSKNPEIKCSKCGSKNITKQIGNMSFILKGGGWSKTGYCKTPSVEGQKSTTAGFAHVADRNSGKSLGYIPTGVAETS